MIKKFVFVIICICISISLMGEVLPEKDPECKNEVKLLETVKNTHPRLLFGLEDIEKLKQKKNTEMGKIFWNMVLSYLPVCKPPAGKKFLKDGTDAQRQGLWRMPTVALHYVLTGDKNSYERAFGYLKLFNSLPDWETTSERNSGMGAASIMVGCALTYDMLYNDLPQDFREEFRKKLLHHARWMYYGGHLNYNRALGYWQNDPLNNHRWFRNAGLFLSMLAIYEGREDEKFMMEKALEEIKFVHKYLPEDGSHHEGVGYLIFGGPMLLFPYVASDRCIGTNFLSHPFFKNVGLFRMETLTPDIKNSFTFGDGGKFGGYHAFLWKPVSYFKEKDIQNGLEKLFSNNRKCFDFGWWNYLWYDPENSGGNYKNLPKTAYFPDNGLVIVRDKWEEDGKAVMFKCSPFGGISLNKFRNEHNYRYINVAHDDPDANSFCIYKNGKMLAETDGYSRSKKSVNHNTILVNGKGQRVKGRREGMVWSQPAVGNVDMLELSFITNFKDEGDIVIVEGEAGPFYGDDLRKFRRTAVWVKNKYFLLLDEIVPRRENTEITWLIQAPEIVEYGNKENKIFNYALKKDNEKCDFKIISEMAGQPEIKVSPADTKGKILGWKQINLKIANVNERLRMITGFNLWDIKNFDVSYERVDDKQAIISIKGDNFQDTWIWEVNDSLKQPSDIKLKK